MAQPLIVVVVEDEIDLQRMLAAVLEEEGFTVLTLSHPAHALSLEPDPKPALFLLDMMMPGMTGIELAQRLRQGRFGDAVLFALSASPSMVQKAAESQLFEETINKPFDIDQLLDSVRRYVS